MASDKPFTLVPPYKQGLRWFNIYTEEQAREAFYSHERRLRLAGRGEIVQSGDPMPVFMWRPSPTFGPPHPIPQTGGGPMAATSVFTTMSLRAEFIMIAYTYVIMTLQNVVNEFTALSAKREQREDARQDMDELRDMCRRLYIVYLILADRIKPHVVMHTLGNILPACAELSIYTVNAMLAFVTGYHSVIGLTLLNRRKEITYKTRRNVFLFIAQQYELTYSILTQHVWIIYGNGSPEQCAFQRYLLGSVLFYRAKVFLCAVEYEKQTAERNANLISILAHKADYLLQVMKSSDAFGYRERAATLGNFATKIIEEAAVELRSNAFYKKRITTIAEYNAGDRFMEFAIHEEASEDLLFLHYPKMGRAFRSDPQYCSLLTPCLFRSSQENARSHAIG